MPIGPDVQWYDRVYRDQTVGGGANDLYANDDLRWLINQSTPGGVVRNVTPAAVSKASASSVSTASPSGRMA